MAIKTIILEKQTRTFHSLPVIEFGQGETIRFRMPDVDGDLNGDILLFSLREGLNNPNQSLVSQPELVANNQRNLTVVGGFADWFIYYNDTKNWGVGNKTYTLDVKVRLADGFVFQWGKYEVRISENLIGNLPSLVGTVPDLVSCELYLNYLAPNVFTTGTGISQWTDLSSAGRHLTQATGSAQPTLDSNGVLFDGTNDFLQANAFNCPDGFSFFIVSRTFATGGVRTVFSNGPAATGFSYRLTTTRNFIFNEVNANSFGAFPTANYEIICANWNRNTGNLQIFINGVLTNTFTNIKLIKSPLGSLLMLGNRATTSEFINSSVKGVLCYSRSLSTQEITDNFTFLNGQFTIY